MASGQPPADPPRPGDSLARHRWVTAAGMTATIAVVAGGGLALAFHDSPAGPPEKCGLVPCAAALPASVRSSGAVPARPPVTAAPTASPRASTPSSAAPSLARPVSAGPVSAPGRLSSPGAVASATGHAASPDRAVGVGYEITADSQHGVHGQLVIANHGSAPVSGWRVRVVLPGDTGYQVRNAGNRSAGDILITAAAGRTLPAGSTTIITFTARGTTSTPLRATFSESARQDGSSHGGSGGAVRAGQSGSGHDGYGGWTGGWPTRGWTGGGWAGGGWTGGGWGGGGWTGGGWGGGWTGGGWGSGGWGGGR